MNYCADTRAAPDDTVRGGQRRTGNRMGTLLVSGLLLLLSGCASFTPQALQDWPDPARVQSQTERGVTVSAGILSDQEAERLLAAGTARYSELEGGGPLLVDHELTDADGWRFRTSHPRLPEQRIAVREADALGFHAEMGLELTEVRYGHWCGRERAAETLGQDLIAARA